ncbi:MAG TPA: cytochrome-c oxidase, cbb3-type subunit III [Burkholderiales bacterium]|nr:cytochrome-c oxidase, cbb3-type subunit III [Burkholderiales bacterium]
MSQFTSGFWDLYIGIISIVSILACAVLLWQQSVQKTAVSQTSDHVWDEDIREYNNPLPRWWMWMFYLTIVFAIGYLALYPGLGSYRGALGWTQVKQLDEENERAQQVYGPLYEKFAAQDVVALSKNAEALAIGQKLFLNNCAQCHASDAAGSRGFPNLTDNDWLWGGTPEAIEATITDGRNGNMPALGAALGEEGVRDAAAYVLEISGNASDSIRAARGKEKFAQICAACHGADGKGNQALGAPNLTDKTWLYGSGAAIPETIANGRAGHMPAHKDLLGPAKIHLLTAYVYSLSRK